MNTKCLICGKDFLNYRNIKKFCSKDCFLKNQKIYNKNYFKNYIVKAETLIRIKEYNDKYNKKKRDLTNEARKSKGLPDLKPRGYWTKARVLEDALNYKTKSEWVNASSAAHNAANKLGIFEEATKHMLVLGNSHKRCIYSIKLPKQNLAYIGLTFNFKRRMRNHMESKRFSELIKLYGRKSIKVEQLTKYLDVDEAIKTEIILIDKMREIGWQMLNLKSGGGLGYKDTFWTEEKILETTKSYNKYNDWRLGNKHAYEAAIKNKKLMEKIYTLLPEGYKIKGPTRWTKQEIFKEALKYKTKNEWYEKSSASCAAAKNLGIFKEASQHMPMPQFKSKLSEEQIANDALKYKRRIDWCRFSPTIYRYTVKKKDLYERVTAHMLPRRSR